jgi:hypothetical protein
MANLYKFLDLEGLQYFTEKLKDIFKTENQINALISKELSKYKQEIVTVVSELPQKGKEGILYMIPHEENSLMFDGYVWEVNEEGQFDWKVLFKGTATIDLSDYYKKSEIDDLLELKANKNEVYTKSIVDGLLNEKVNHVDMIAISSAEIDATMV